MTSTDAARRPTSSLASRRAACSGASPGRRRPPGKDTSPPCERRWAARRVSTTLASPSWSNNRHSTAAGRVSPSGVARPGSRPLGQAARPGAGTGPPTPDDGRRPVSRRRRPRAGPAHGRGSQADPAGRGDHERGTGDRARAVQTTGAQVGGGPPAGPALGPCPGRGAAARAPSPKRPTRPESSRAIGAGHPSSCWP